MYRRISLFAFALSIPLLAYAAKDEGKPALAKAVPPEANDDGLVLIFTPDMRLTYMKRDSCLEDDADGDRLLDCDEDAIGTDAQLADTDGDGLSDGDEVLGTVEGLDLPSFGVDPLHKDLLVEMDWTDEAFECAAHSHRPSAQSIADVVLFFASVPVSNPDGNPGINFIADYGQGGAFAGGNHISIPDGITSALGATFYGYKTANFATDRNGYFRYQLHGHRWAYNEGSSGYGLIFGDDSVVTLSCSVGSEDFVRNTIIHELGHNLGLEHGGATACNQKPNYNSLMNYKYQFHGVDTDCDTIPDGGVAYSAGTRTTLVDGQLSESAGVCPLSHPNHQPVDWNGNGVIDLGFVSLPSPQQLAYGCAQTSSATDHDDYAALEIGPFTPKRRVAAPPKFLASDPCPPPPSN